MKHSVDDESLVEMQALFARLAARAKAPNRRAMPSELALRCVKLFLGLVKEVGLESLWPEDDTACMVLGLCMRVEPRLFEALCDGANYEIYRRHRLHALYSRRAERTGSALARARSLHFLKARDYEASVLEPRELVAAQCLATTFDPHSGERTGPSIRYVQSILDWGTDPARSPSGFNHSKLVGPEREWGDGASAHRIDPGHCSGGART